MCLLGINKDYLHIEVIGIGREPFKDRDSPRIVYDKENGNKALFVSSASGQCEAMPRSILWAILCRHYQTAIVETKSKQRQMGQS